MQDQGAKHGTVELNVGAIKFSGSGDQQWLSEQIAVLIEAAKTIPGNNSATNEATSDIQREDASVVVGSLATYLKAKGAETKQSQRFLATAAWLHHRGNRPLSTRLVSQTLREHQQKRLGNPSECLNQNVGRGFCEKTPDGFFITPEGWQQLGEDR